MDHVNWPHRHGIIDNSMPSTSSRVEAGLETMSQVKNILHR